jgi:Flp pilus assembly protein protease CpaA
VFSWCKLIVHNDNGQNYSDNYLIFFGFLYFLYVLFGFPLKSSNLTSIEIILLANFFCFVCLIFLYYFDKFGSFDLDLMVTKCCSDQEHSILILFPIECLGGI